VPRRRRARIGARDTSGALPKGPPMLGHIFRQVGNMAITLVAITLLVFLLNELTPGDVASKILGPYATQEQVDHLTRQMGLDRPMAFRYLEFVGRALLGDFGESIVYRQPAIEVLWDRLRNTLLLAGIAFAVIVPLSILLGTLAGMRERSRVDRGVNVFSALCASIPEFAMGVFLLAIFVVWLKILPGVSPLNADSGWPIWTQFVLPVAVVTLYDAGYLVAMIRQSMVEVMRQPFIRTAVLKGMDFRRVVLRHALRNALIAPFTVILLQLNYLVSGLVVVETVFAYPGFGRLMLEAALAKDIALLEAGTLVAVSVTMLTQLAGDIGYMALDPRIRV
jgi:peptide/nickel transport system permease protein